MSSEIRIEKREHDEEIGAFIGEAFETYAAQSPADPTITRYMSGI